MTHYRPQPKGEHVFYGSNTYQAALTLLLTTSGTHTMFVTGLTSLAACVVVRNLSSGTLAYHTRALELLSLILVLFMTLALRYFFNPLRVIPRAKESYPKQSPERWQC